MKKYLLLFIGVLTAFVVSATAVLAATLQITSIGGISTGTQPFTTFETTQVSPTFVGTAAPDAAVDIQIDDLIVAVTANPAGAWSYTPVNLSEGSHAVEISSNLETLTFTLVVNPAASVTTTSTSTDSTTKGDVSTSSAELPRSGALENTILLIAAGVFLMGFGVVAHHKLPAPEQE